VLSPITVTLPWLIWVVAGLAWATELAFTWKARGRAHQARRKYQTALDSVAVAVDDRPLATVTQLRLTGGRAARARSDRPRHDLDFVEQMAVVRDESR